MIIKPVMQLAPLAFMLASAPASADDAGALPRLSGVLVSATTSQAIFEDGRGVTQTVATGDTLGAYRVVSIAPGSVTLAGQAGPRVLVVEGADAFSALPDMPPAPPIPLEPTAPFPVVAAAEDAGRAIGALANARDRCAAERFLPGSGQDASRQLDAVLGAMEHMHDEPSAGDPARAAPARAMAVAMRRGWRDAEAGQESAAPDAAGCDRVARQWARTAPRYGLR